MARPRSQTVDYFPHDVAHSGRTMFVIERHWGNDGYSFWFKLLETLGRTEGHYIDIGDPATWEFLLAKTRITEETAVAILEKLAGLGAIDPELLSIKIIWSDNFVERLTPVYGKRTTEIPKKPEFSPRKLSNNEGYIQPSKDFNDTTTQNSEFSPRKPNGTEGFSPRKPDVNGISDVENPQSKVKYSKVNISPYPLNGEKFGIMIPIHKYGDPNCSTSMDPVCSYCGATQKENPGLGFTYDHFIPKAEGGSDDPDNLILSCNPCNYIKGKKLVESISDARVYIHQMLWSKNRQRWIDHRQIAFGGSPPDGYKPAEKKLSPQILEHIKTFFPMDSKGIMIDKFAALWLEWITLKTGSKFKNIPSMKKGVTKLMNLCDRNYELAVQIVDQSLAAPYQGLFELKKEYIQSRSTARSEPDTPESVTMETYKVEPSPELSDEDRAARIKMIQEIRKNLDDGNPRSGSGLQPLGNIIKSKPTGEEIVQAEKAVAEIRKKIEDGTLDTGGETDDTM